MHYGYSGISGETSFIWGNWSLYFPRDFSLFYPRYNTIMVFKNSDKIYWLLLAGILFNKISIFFLYHTKENQMHLRQIYNGNGLKIPLIIQSKLLKISSRKSITKFSWLIYQGSNTFNSIIEHCIISTEKVISYIIWIKCTNPGFSLPSFKDA